MAIQALDANASNAVFAFLDRIVSARGREYWQWKYRLGQTDSPSAFYWQEPDGSVLGFIGLMHTSLHVGQEKHPAAWFVDWHVAPGEQGVGVGFGLLRKAEAAAGMLLTLQGSRDTQQILPRLGWKQSLSPVTWVRPLSARFASKWVEQRVPRPLRLLTRLALPAVKSYLHCRQPTPWPGIELVGLDRFPAEYDHIWTARKGEFAPAMTRDSAYLNYLCADYPEGGYRLWLVRRRQEPAGHLIWRIDMDRRGFRRGRIVDVLWPRSQRELLMWLIESACWQLQQADADYVECVASVPDLGDALRCNRFRVRAPVPLWYHRLPAAVPDPSGWYISFLDCDRAYR